MREKDNHRFSFTEEGFVDRNILLDSLDEAEFEAYNVVFARAVSLHRCSFRSFEVEGGAFQRGLDLADCHFSDPFYFFASGHNLFGSQIRIRRCTFHSFADFGDCWFEGPFEIIDCDFQEGTNLMGNLNTPIEVTFDVPPVLTRVSGELRLNSFHPNP